MTCLMITSSLSLVTRHPNSPNAEMVAACERVAAFRVKDDDRRVELSDSRQRAMLGRYDDVC